VGLSLLRDHERAWRGKASLSVHSIQAAPYACEQTGTLQAGVELASLFACFSASFFNTLHSQVAALLLFSDARLPLLLLADKVVPRSKSKVFNF
jgi:hypothetical protein